MRSSFSQRSPSPTTAYNTQELANFRWISYQWMSEVSCLFPRRIDDWQLIEDHGITAVIDPDGDLDLGIPSVPNHMLYVYFPVYDEGLPDLNKLHALARLGAHLVASGEKVLLGAGLGHSRRAELFLRLYRRSLKTAATPA